jgi:hypothetical protein
VSHIYSLNLCNWVGYGFLGIAFKSPSDSQVSILQATPAKWKSGVGHFHKQLHRV